MRRLARIATLLVVLALPASASAGWQQVVPGSLSVDPAHDHDGNGPSLVEFGGAPTVAFSENDGAGHNQVWVRQLVDGAWVTVGSFLRNDSSAAAHDPSLAVVGGTLYAAWDEAGKTRVARYSGGSWSFVGTSNGLVDTGGIP